MKQRCSCCGKDLIYYRTGTGWRFCGDCFNIKFLDPLKSREVTVEEQHARENWDVREISGWEHFGSIGGWQTFEGYEKVRGEMQLFVEKGSPVLELEKGDIIVLKRPGRTDKRLRILEHDGAQSIRVKDEWWVGREGPEDGE